jgi:peroxiredoxin
VTTLKDKPFAVIGVNSWLHEPGELKTVMTQQKINWRTFDDAGEINRQWNFPATPAFYIIDQKGTIRHKWIGKPGEKTIDTALVKLIKAAETTAPRK